MFSPKEPLVQIRHPEAELIRDYGSHTLAFTGLAPGNLHFLAGGGLVNYRLSSNVAVVLGDPICEPQAFEQVTQSFLDFCALNGWRVAFYQATSEHLATYRSFKMREFKIGEEAIIPLESFTLSGSAMANVRTSCRRAEREGVIIDWYDGVPPAEVMQQLQYISNTWLEHKGGSSMSETSFSTGRLDELLDLAEQSELVASISRSSSLAQRTVPQLVTAVATTASGKPCAFVTFLPLYGFLGGAVAGSRSEMQGWGWTLDLMRRVPDAPPGVIELLLVRSMQRFQVAGGYRVSLGMVAMADGRQEMTLIQHQFASFVSGRLHLLESRQTLFSFKQKFQPRWESRYIVINSTLALPKIALAVLRLRNYPGGGLVKWVK
jgi:lysylphosphatidylglycerol synthetase-like protein (DUF2156 family)